MARLAIRVLPQIYFTLRKYLDRIVCVVALWTKAEPRGWTADIGFLSSFRMLTAVSVIVATLRLVVPSPKSAR